MTPPVVSVQLAKALQPPLFDAHASVSTPTDVMYRNNNSDEDDDEDDDNDAECVYSSAK